MNAHQERSGYYTEEGLARTIVAATCDPAFPQYGYGVVQAAALAGQLGYPAFSALELGVAGGNGLLALQDLATAHSTSSGVAIDVAGFDLATGMPPPLDYRDLPYIWQAGFFEMDELAIRRRLTTAQLHIGDVQDTIPAYLASGPPPIGFISFDLDYYSSTVRAFSALLDAEPNLFLPRVVCYFDDTVGPHHEMHSRFAGELLAIDEFNGAHRLRKLGQLHGLRHKVAPNDGPWIEGIYILHLFDHARYNEYIFHRRNRQFPLASG